MANGNALPITVAAGPLQARLFRDSGRVSLVGPDLGGAALANEVMVSPPSAWVAGQTVSVGRVLSSADIPGGIEAVQEFGTAKVRVQLTFPTDGVLRYEVIDWGGVAPEQTSFSVAATPGERVYGMGEKFNPLDQTGKTALVQTFDQPGDKGDRSYKVVP